MKDFTKKLFLRVQFQFECAEFCDVPRHCSRTRGTFRLIVFTSITLVWMCLYDFISWFARNRAGWSKFHSHLIDHCRRSIR